MPTAEIITIGTEILLGEIIDTNARYIARVLRQFGVDVYRTGSIGDNQARIASAIQDSLSRADIVLTTGGLGPTVDDTTRDAVAQAFGVKTVFREDLWDQVQERFARFNRVPDENNRQQAYIPDGAVAIENPVGTAPSFRMERDGKVVICLPGVPREMEHLLEKEVIPHLKSRFELGNRIVIRVLRTAGVGESQIDARIADLERLSNPTVGLGAHSGQVDVRITAKAASELEAATLIEGVEREIRQRLGDWIFGVDEESLAGVAMRNLQTRGWRLVALEGGLQGKLLRQFAQPAFPHFLRGEVLPAPPPDPHDWLPRVAAYQQMHASEVALGVALYQYSPTRADIALALITPDQEKDLRLPYGGPPQLAPRRAINLGLDELRKL